LGRIGRGRGLRSCRGLRAPLSRKQLWQSAVCGKGRAEVLSRARAGGAPQSRGVLGSAGPASSASASRQCWSSSAVARAAAASDACAAYPPGCLYNSSQAPLCRSVQCCNTRASHYGCGLTRLLCVNTGCVRQVHLVCGRVNASLRLKAWIQAHLAHGGLAAALGGRVRARGARAARAVLQRHRHQRLRACAAAPSQRSQSASAGRRRLPYPVLAALCCKVGDAHGCESRMRLLSRVSGRVTDRMRATGVWLRETGTGQVERNMRSCRTATCAHGMPQPSSPHELLPATP